MQVSFDLTFQRFIMFSLHFVLFVIWWKSTYFSSDQNSDVNDNPAANIMLSSIQSSSTILFQGQGAK